MTCLNSTNVRLIPIEEPDPEIWGEESSSKWDRLQIVLAPKWRVNTKVDPSRLDPSLKVIISQCDTIKNNMSLTYLKIWPKETLQNFLINIKFQTIAFFKTFKWTRIENSQHSATFSNIRLPGDSSNDCRRIYTSDSPLHFYCIFTAFLLRFYCVFTAFLLRFYCILTTFLLRFYCVFTMRFCKLRACHRL